LDTRRVCAALLCLILAAWPCRAGDPVPPPGPGIADNSFLIEEAYNQEPGVIQHINAFTWFDDDTWAYTFTDEWPVGSHAHQLSVTVPVVEVEERTGFGDVALNYRYQLLDGAVAFAPRLSVLLPTGSWRDGLGAGGPGVQLNLPLSASLGPRFVSHTNLGATWTSSARNVDGEQADLWLASAGQSLVWLAHSRFNVLCELVWTDVQEVAGAGATRSENTLHLSPGIRWAHNFASGLQIVPGVAVPIGIGPSAGSTGLLLYLSLEHPLPGRR
jgi:hypothetical protein